MARRGHGCGQQEGEAAGNGQGPGDAVGSEHVDFLLAPSDEEPAQCIHLASKCPESHSLTELSEVTDHPEFLTLGRDLRMNFGFTDEQEFLRSEVRKLLDEKAPLEDVRRVSEAESGPGYDIRSLEGDRRTRVDRPGHSRSSWRCGPGLGRSGRRARGDRPQPLPGSARRNHAGRGRDREDG